MGIEQGSAILDPVLGSDVEHGDTSDFAFNHFDPGPRVAKTGTQAVCLEHTIALSPGFEVTWHRQQGEARWIGQGLEVASPGSGNGLGDSGVPGYVTQRSTTADIGPTADIPRSGPADHPVR